MKDSYKIIGLMSGTSLDGLDIAYCSFEGENHYSILECKTIPYDTVMQKKLQHAHLLTAEALHHLDAMLAQYFAEKTTEFIKEHAIIDLDAIASHGHTVFHQPKHGFTLQIANPALIAAFCSIPCVGDFRSADIALGGQGAPLVPIGDRYLFSEYSNRVNLGGFANTSYEDGNKSIAFDICPLNIVMNEMAQGLGQEYDKDGSLARSGKIDPILLKTLHSLPYYAIEGPKSLGIEWVKTEIYPILEKNKVSTEDALATFCEHAAEQISKALRPGKSLFTGGGTKNTFLMEKLKDKTPYEIVIPELELIDFKEAMVFAYLGMRRLKGSINVLASVTGAKRDHCAGSLHLP